MQGVTGQADGRKGGISSFEIEAQRVFNAWGKMEVSEKTEFPPRVRPKSHPKSASNRVSKPAVLSHKTRCGRVPAREIHICSVSSFGFATVDSLRHTDLGRTLRIKRKKTLRQRFGKGRPC
jgi:hypothetical protein